MTKRVQALVVIANQSDINPLSCVDFDPFDLYLIHILRLINQKIKRGATADIEPYNEPEKEPTGKKGKVLDLMPLLKESLSRGRRPAAKAASKSKRKVTHGTAKAVRA